MTWNYRAVKTGGVGADSFAIYEVYYDGDRITHIAKDPSEPHGETLEELKTDLEHMQQAFNKPILDLKKELAKFGL